MAKLGRVVGQVRGTNVSGFANSISSDSEEGSRLSNILFGRFMLPDMSEHPCQVTDLTEDGAIFVTSSVPASGLALVAYLEDLGRVEAVSADPTIDGFRVVFSAEGARRERLLSRITWYKQKQVGDSDHRRHPRYEPREKQSQITLPDGRVYSCEVLDISVSGAAIKTDVMPSIGTYVMLGKMKGRVVRYLETGVAVEFIKQLDTVAFSSSVSH
jgi:hypothetical protein